MTLIKHYPIEWFAERLKTPFSLARFGDGEFLCIEGKQGGNSHGCAYTPGLRKDLITALNFDAPGYFKGMQRILPAQLKRVRPLLHGDWVDSEIFADALIEGGMKPFFEILRTKDVMIVSSPDKRAMPISYKYFVETPRTNAHAEKERIVKEVLEHCKPGMIVLFACGMAAGTFVQALHAKAPSVSFIDIGHIFDPFIGEMSREYLANTTQEKILENLA